MTDSGGTRPRPPSEAAAPVGEPGVEEVLALLEAHQAAMAVSISMVPSEASFSGLAKVPMMLDAYHRYFFNETGAPERWTFRGAQGLGEAETGLTVGLLRRMAKAEHVSVKPLSGLNAMTVALASYAGPPGSPVVTIAGDNGGHYATVDVARRLGLDVEFLRGPTPHELDWDDAAAVLRRHRPRLVYVDQSHCLFPIDVQRLVDVVRTAAPDARVHVDASHWMGFVLAGEFPNPLDCGADSFGGSTHKTFPGPHKAVLLTRDPALHALVEATQDFMISSHHFAETVSLGIALAEFAAFGPTYTRNLRANTTGFGAALEQRGVPVVAADRGYSAGHQLWLDVEAAGFAAPRVSARLARAGMRVNFMRGLPGFAGFGVRVGLNEATFHGLTADDVPVLADVFAAAVHAEDDAAELDVLATRVADLRRRWRERAPAAPTDRLLDRARALVGAGLPQRYLGPVDGP